jgi:hypothetical protein
LGAALIFFHVQISKKRRRKHGAGIFHGFVRGQPELALRACWS